MTRKKSGFLTFCFSLIPGAGEMYMGFMKQGISIMAVFWILVFFASFLNVGPMLFILPILWCYSFFNVHNIRGMSDEEFYALEDDYLFHLDSALDQGKWKGKQTNFLAAALIIAGVAILWRYIGDCMRWMLPDSVYWIMIDSIPQVVIALLLIWGGIYLIRGKKKELDGKAAGQEEWNDMPMRQEEPVDIRKEQDAFTDEAGKRGNLPDEAQKQEG